MKTTIAAAMLALATGCGSSGHAADRDSAFIAHLKSHSLHATVGTSEYQWEKLSIDEAHNICDLMEKGDLAASHDATIIVDAAISTFCPF